MEGYEAFSIPIISLLCYGFIEALKRALKQNEKFKDAYPLISALLGLLLGVTAFYVEPELMLADSLFSSALLGMSSGLSATGSNELFHRIKRRQAIAATMELPNQYYVAGRNCSFENIIKFCYANQLDKKDTIIVLKTSAVTTGDLRNEKLLAELNATNVTILFLQGQEKIEAKYSSAYKSKLFCGGITYYNEAWSNILVAKDGEVYKFNQKSYIIIGNCEACDIFGESVCSNELETSENQIMETVRKNLAARNNTIDGFLTYAYPDIYIVQDALRAKKAWIGHPTEASAYEANCSCAWLEHLMNEIQYDIWYCGSDSSDNEIGKFRLLHRNIVPLRSENGEIV